MRSSIHQQNQILDDLTRLIVSEILPKDPNKSDSHLVLLKHRQTRTTSSCGTSRAFLPRHWCIIFVRSPVDKSRSTLNTHAGTWHDPRDYTRLTSRTSCKARLIRRNHQHLRATRAKMSHVSNMSTITELFCHARRQDLRFTQAQTQRSVLELAPFHALLTP
ncbi:hypothetical protein BT63DRAFT_80267 [Microthyrium microscopicum]|uniref:Uncharacterized protein n=1 Tax=Microthyrium microscopicum TaxID=703497 RepID=A0A6A6U0Z5_9PEZI|nr:hypothetical protein BT63DRAFT_80267 [Microthyrium microscopicum]